MISKLFIGKNIEQSRNTFAWTAASGIVYSAQSFLFLMVITNLMGETAASLYSLGFMIANQMLTVGKYSVRNFQVSDINQKYTFDQYYTFRVFTCLVAMVITAGWILFGGYRGDEAIVILSLTVYKMAECMSDLFEGLYQQRFRFDISGKSQFFKDLIMLVVYIVAIIISKDVVISSVILAVVSMALIFIIDFPIANKFDKIKWNFNIKITWQLIVACFSLFISSFSYVYVNNAPKYAVSNLFGSDSGALARFNALFMPVFVIDLFAGFTLRMWLTKMAVFHRDGEYRRLKSTILKQFLIIIVITAVCTAGMYFFGGTILTLLYGIDLTGYESTNAVLMIAGGMVAVYNLFENVIIIYRKQHASIIFNVVASIVSAVICTKMAESNGIFGASVAYLIASAIRTLLYYLFALYCMRKGQKNGESH